MATIDVNKIMLSNYNNVLSMNKNITNAVGVDTKWMRSVPHENSEDVIFNEYTLYDVECPVDVKVVTTNSGYNPGNFSIDYFGIQYEAPFEVQIDKLTWEAAYGKEVMPQKGDIVYVALFNCLYEVATSTIIYGYMERETGYKVELVKYNPKTNRRESEAVAETIDTLTNSTEDLFAEAISNEVSDLVDGSQTDAMINTTEPKHDIYKENDINAIINDEIWTDVNIVSRSCYDLRKMKTSLIWDWNDQVDSMSEDFNRLFTCWFKIPDDEKVKEYDIKLERDPEMKSRFALTSVNGSNFTMRENERLMLTRGNFIKIQAAVTEKREVNGKMRWMIAFDKSEFMALNQRMTDFWKMNMKMTKSVSRSLLMAKTNGQQSLDISLIGTSGLYVKFGAKEREITLANPIPTDQWVGIGVNLGPESLVVIYAMNDEGKWTVREVASLGNMQNDFLIGSFYNTVNDLLMTNIRWYRMNSIADPTLIERDLNTRTVKNESKAAINDSAITPNFSPYIIEQR